MIRGHFGIIFITFDVGRWKKENIFGPMEYTGAIVRKYFKKQHSWGEKKKRGWDCSGFRGMNVALSCFAMWVAP